MAIGLAAAAINGLTQPMFSYVFGNMTDSFGPASTPDEVVRQSGIQALWLLGLGVLTFILSWVS